MQRIADKLEVEEPAGSALLDLVFSDPHWQPCVNDQWGSTWRYHQKNIRGAIEFDWRNPVRWHVIYEFKIGKLAPA